MTIDPNRILGVTPVNMRLAFAYLMKGEGWHDIDNPDYDKVHVTVADPWQQLQAPVAGVSHGATTKVLFYKDGRCVRHIDFSILCSGGGGDPTIQVLENDDQC